MSDSQSKMLTELVRLRSALQDVSFPLDVAGAEDLRRTRREMVDQLEDYVIPRVMTLEAPLLVVVGGSTGAGKSTLVNSVVGTRVTQPGLLRPTTRSPVLVHHPDDGEWFGQDRLLPDLRRVDHATDAPDAIQLVASDRVPRGIAILDAPDVDSVEEQNRVLAAQLLAAGDLWLFVTSAARYADQVPWDHLRQAAERSTAVAIVLDRTPADAVETVATHLARMLAARGLKDAPLFIVHEGPVTDDGLLPAANVADVRGWLESLAQDEEGRGEKVSQTLQGAIRTLTKQTHPLADAAEEQLAAADVLRGELEAAYDEAVRVVTGSTSDGSIMRGELLARWQEFVGTGELLRSLENRGGWLRERVVSAVKGKPQQAERVTVAVESALELLVLEQAEVAAERVAASWRGSAAGTALLLGTDLGRASRDLRRTAERSVRDWQADVLEMVRTEGADLRTTARFLAFGVNGLSVTLMVAVFDEHQSAGESTALGRTLLDAVFGQEAVLRLVERARVALGRRTEALLTGERARYGSVLGALSPGADAPGALRRAARRVDDIRYAQQISDQTSDADDETLHPTGRSAGRPSGRPSGRPTDADG